MTIPVDPTLGDGFCGSLATSEDTCHDVPCALLGGQCFWNKTVSACGCCLLLRETCVAQGFTGVDHEKCTCKNSTGSGGGNGGGGGGGGNGGGNEYVYVPLSSSTLCLSLSS